MDDLNEVLFSSATPAGVSQANSRYNTPNTNFYASTLSNFNPTQLPNKSDNKTREDLEELIGEIPFPNDDLSLTSFTSGTSNNTPQKFYQSQGRGHTSSNRYPRATSEERKPPIMITGGKSLPKQALAFSSDKRVPQNNYNSSQQRPVHLNFDNDVIFEDPGLESLTPNQLNKYVSWTKQHVTPGDSKNLFPQVVAPSIDMSRDGSLSQSRNNTKERYDMSKYSNDNQDITIDHIHEKESLSDRKSPRNNNRILPSVRESYLRIETKRYQEQIAALESEVNFQKKKYTNLEKENNYLTNKVNELEEHLNFLQEKYNDDSSLDALRARSLATAKTQMKQLKELLEKKDEKISDLSSQLQYLKKNDQIYRESVETELSNLHLEAERAKILADTHKKRTNELEIKLRETFQQNLVGDQQKDHLIDNLNAQISDNKEEISKLKSEINEGQGTIERLAKHINELNELLEKATEDLEEKEKEIEHLKKQSENFLVEQHKLSNLESDTAWEQRYAALTEELDRVKEIKEREIIKLKEIISQQKESFRNMEENTTRKDNDFNLSVINGNPKVFNTMDSLFQHEDFTSPPILSAKDEEIRNLKTQYEKEIALYRSQVEELSQRINLLERESNNSVLDKLHTTRQSFASTRGDKLTVSQSTNCTLYLEPLENLMSTLNIFSEGKPNYEEDLKKVYEYAKELNDNLQKLERDIVEFKKKQITIKSELDCTKMENEQLKETMRDMQVKDTENVEKMISLHNEIADLKRTVISLESQPKFSSFLGTSPRSTRSKREIDTFRDQDDELAQEHLQLKEDYKALENEHINAKETIQKLQSKCKELDLELKRSSSQVQRAKDEIELLKVELESKTAGEKNHWEQVKKNLNDKIKALEQKKESLMDEIRQKDFENAELKGKLEAMEVEVRNNEIEYSHLIEETRNEVSDRIPQLERRNKELQAEMLGKEEEIINMKMKLKEIEFELEQEKEETQQSLERRQNLETDRENVREENTTLLEQINRLNEIIERRDVELNKIMNEKHTIESENERLSLGLDKEKNKEDVLHQLKDTLNTRDRQLNELKEKVENLNIELNKEKEKGKKLKDVENTLKDKENELKYVVETAKKKETHDAKTSNELALKKKDFEKLQNSSSQLEKELEIIKKERNELKQTVENLQKLMDKSEPELRKKDEAIKQLEDKNKKNAQYLKDKDKANVELFKVNKDLTENLKTMEETHANLKIEFEKKGKTLAQKMAEIKTLSQTNKTLEESNQELANEVMELKIKLQQFENEVSSKKVKAFKNINLHDESLSHFESQFNEREATRETERPHGESIYDSKSKSDVERLLQSFSEREAQFENIKHNFVEKIMSMNERIVYYEQRCGSLSEENNFLNTQLGLYQNANENLKERIKQLETNIKQWPSVNDSGYDFMQKLDTKRDTMSSLVKTRGVMEDFGDVGYRDTDMDELRPPTGYETGVLKFTKGNDFDMKSTVGGYDEKVTTNVFANNIMDMISPEMLSTEETVSLMLEVLRRASHSHELAVLLGQNKEFKDLTSTIRKHCVLEEQNPNINWENNYVSFSGKIRKQARTGESFYNYE